MAGALGALVDRQQLASTPKQVFNPLIFLLAATISFAGGLHGANTSNISGILAVSWLLTSLPLWTLDS
jgi:SP family sugar:H+ symporter-like MFS transporter